MHTLDYFTPFTYFFKSKSWLRKFIIASLNLYSGWRGAHTGLDVCIVDGSASRKNRKYPELADGKAYGGWAVSLRVNTLWLLPVLLAPSCCTAGDLRPYHPARMMLTVFGAVLSFVLVLLAGLFVVYAFFFPPCRCCCTGRLHLAVGSFHAGCGRPSGRILSLLMVS